MQQMNYVGGSCYYKYLRLTTCFYDLSSQHHQHSLSTSALTYIFFALLRCPFLRHIHFLKIIHHKE